VFVQTTSQLKRVFSVIITVAGMTPQISTVEAVSSALAAAAPTLPRAAAAELLRDDVNESLQLSDATNSSATAAPMPSHLSLALCMASSCHRDDHQ
jgi:hypothetical protein